MALDLGKLLKAVSQSDLIVLPQYNRYLIRNPECFPVTEEIADRIKSLMVTPPRDRSRSFSSSAAGTCHRRQVFDYIGTVAGKDTVIDPSLARIFANGTWSHMRTQVSLLMAGILDDIELPLPWPKMREKGTADGVGTVPDTHPKTHWRGKEFGFEFKTINSYGYRSAVEEGPDRYRDQASRYMLKAGWDLYVIVMESKDTQECYEWVLEPDPAMMAAQKAELKALNQAVDKKQLPGRLPDCQLQRGEVFRRCPYGGKNGPCMRVESWPGV